ncbi:MAG: capsular polysaccharide biosynthesis protein [Bacteroidetes bacterium OLB10]|nr:MAG: capsular polysaccharide biosynthesis protein [Bacteroidetes bacterium OLB10]MBX3107465.1 AAA family ATPase [Bacteroidota bacterium]MCB8931293.1 AAA family ATPase [Bacteroidia bacterium]MCW5930267.1 AAA family ATPase [Bacteroidota bacterium]
MTTTFWSQRMMLRIKAHRRFLIFCLAAGSLGAGAYLYFTPKEYESKALLKPISESSDNMYAEAAVIQSPATIRHAIHGKGLNTEYYRNRLFKTQELFTETPVKVSFQQKDDSFSKQAFGITFENDKTYLLNYEYNYSAVQKRGNYDEPLDLNFAEVTISKTPYMNTVQPHDNYSFIIYSDNALAQKIAEGKLLSKPVRSDNLVEISYRNENPVKAYRVVHALSNGYGQNGTVMNEEKMQANVSLINQQLARVSQDLDDAQQQLSKFQAENNAFEIPQQAGAALQTVSQLQIQKVEADMQLAALDNLSDYLRKNRNVNTISPEYGTINDIVYTETYLKLNDKVAERQQLKEQGADVSHVDREINSLKDMLAESIRNTRKKLVIKQETLADAIVNAKLRMQNLPEAESKMQQLSRNIYLYNKLYDFLIEKRAEAMVTAPAIPASSYLVNDASMPLAPISPNPVKVWLVALALSLAAGMSYISLKPYFRTKISNRKDLQQHCNIPFLATIENSGHRNELSESFMNLCTKVLMLGNSQPVKMITVTSIKAEEGKTTISQNLAKTLGSLGKKVLLVDMNPVNPTLRNNLSSENEHTMAEVYAEEKNLHQAVQITPDANVDLLTAGYLPHGINTLLVSDKTGNILAEIKSLYDFVIFDTPETSNYMDAVPLMKTSDLSFYVLKANESSLEQLEQASVIKQDYSIENLYIIINATQKIENFSGLQTTGQYRVLKNREQADAEIKFIPRVMKKAALWFY